ncbi:MAG: SDR family oxidoreductase, partial [Pseudomonadales bacterium]
EMTAELRQNEAMVAKWLEEIPQNRLGLPGDVAGLVMFLCSDEASYITGTELVIDGGMTA